MQRLTWGAQNPPTHLYHSSYICGSGKVMKEWVERLQKPEIQEVGCETASPRNCFIDKTRTKVMSMDMLMKEEENFLCLGVPPLNKECQATNDWWEKGNWSRLGMTLLIVCLLLSGHPQSRVFAVFVSVDREGRIFSKTI